ncbi:MAG: hypothetical protein ABJZ55_04335 [Fuerstiella sp.]
MALPNPKYPNSAGRLLSLLSNIPAGQQLLEVIPRLFDAKPTTPQSKQQACLAGMMEMHRLYLEFRQDMMDADISEEQRDVLLNGLTSIQDSIYPTQLTGGFRAPTDAEKSLLEVCATILPVDGQIKGDDIDAIRESISSLRTIIESGDISPTLRKALLELVRLSEDAISRFSIRGARGLKKAFKEMLGEAAELYGLSRGDDAAEELQSSPAWATIVNHLRLVDSVASRLLKYKPLIENATQLLLGGPTA